MKFKKDSFDTDVNDLFRKGSKIDVAINYNMHNQLVGKSIIFKTNYTNNQIALYQPRDFKLVKNQKLNLSTLILGKHRPSLDAYVMDAVEHLAKIEYEPKIKLISLRRGYRIDPNELYKIKGIVHLNKEEKTFTNEFYIKDISLCGVSFISKTNNYKNKDVANYNKFVSTIDAVFLNKDTSQMHNIQCPIKLVRIKELENCYLGGYEFNPAGLSKIASQNLNDNLAKIVRDSEIKKRQIETKYYKGYD